MLNSLLAQVTSAPAPGGAAAPPAQNPTTMILWFVAIIVIFWFLMLRPKQKEQKSREQMLKNIKKYDKVVTIGGIIGTVMEVRDEEIIVKVDENSNARIKFTRGAIQRVLVSAEGDKKE